MNRIDFPFYNLHWTLMGGQSFSWDFDPETESYIGFTQNKAIKLKLLKDDNGPSLLWQTYPLKDDFEFLKKYLRLDIDYHQILTKITKDKHIENAISVYPNLRLLNQDFEQTLLSFLISPNNTIKNIRNSVRLMNLKFGEKLSVDGREIYLFPKTERLTNADIEKLLETRIGFRAKNVKGAAQYLVENNLTEDIQNLDLFLAREKLIGIKGIGDKIADCILVFGLSHDDITPLDVWGKRFLTEYYNLDPKMKYEEMRIWVSEYFEGYAAWAGQFLFEYIRNLPKDKNTKP